MGGASNHTQSAEKEAKKKINDAKWAAYQRSGEVVLIIVVIAAGAWGFFIWRQRRKGAAYSALSGEENNSRGSSRMPAMRRRHGGGDIEAAAFDETRLDNLRVESPLAHDGSKYSIGDDSDEEEADNKRFNGETKRNNTGAGRDLVSKP